MADEIVAVVSACLDNVVAHVGPSAPAWVLLEATPDALVVTVRDEGPGIPQGRLEEAELAGRLGVASSVRGRVAELGGTASLSTGSHGTEWELSFPRDCPSPSSTGLFVSVCLARTGDVEPPETPAAAAKATTSHAIGPTWSMVCTNTFWCQAAVWER